MNKRIDRRFVVVVSAFILAVSCAAEPSSPPRTPANESAATSGRPAAPQRGPAEPTPTPSASAETALPDVTTTKWTGDLDGMISRRVIRVLTTYSKVNYFVDQATQYGLIYDAFRQFEADLNAKLKTKNLRVQVIFVPVAHDELVPSLLAGRGDIVAAGILLTEWRHELVDFSSPIRTNVSSIIVSGRDVSPVRTPLDVAGREVYLRLSDVSKHGVDSFNATLTAAGKAPVTIRPAPEVLADEDILEMVNAGIVPMTLVNDYIAEFWQQVFPNLTLNRGAAARTDLQTGMLVRKNSSQLLNELNAFIARYPEGSLKRNLLMRDYLKSQKYVRNATSQQEQAKFDRIAVLIQKYSDQYKLDALLMAAQGYQESGLDQSVKSPVGAIGVMQVMPATGKELAVGDITKVEPNIHAGVKYVRLMMDQDFANEPMDDLNKGLFTFASYNAGPGRIRELRQEAAKRGLNPNLWFNNVEVVAAEVIGRETVQYVANIYKYYLAYTMLTEQRDERRKALEAAEKKQ